MNATKNKNKKVRRAKPVRFSEMLTMPSFNALFAADRQHCIGRRNLFVPRLLK